MIRTNLTHLITHPAQWSHKFCWVLSRVWWSFWISAVLDWLRFKFLRRNGAGAHGSIPALEPDRIHNWYKSRCHRTGCERWRDRFQLICERCKRNTLSTQPSAFAALSLFVLWVAAANWAGSYFTTILTLSDVFMLGIVPIFQLVGTPARGTNGRCQRVSMSGCQVSSDTTSYSRAGPAPPHVPVPR